MNTDKFGKNTNHVWSFSTIGGVKRVNFETGGDLLNLSQLDQKLWTALSCPVNNLEIDKKTLALIDTDKDGQIRAPELLGAVNWITALLKNPGDLLKQEQVLTLSAINDQCEEGKILASSFRIILDNLGKKDTTLTVAETSDTERIFAATRFNGDGIITEETAASPDLVSIVQDVIKCLGSVKDRTGKPGINQELLENFIGQCQKYSDWIAKKEADPGAVFPLGEDTDQAYNNYAALKAKIDDYFIRCRLAAFDPQSTEVLNLQVARVETITAKDLSGCLSEIAAYPLARVEAGRALPVSVGINPAWEQNMVVFCQLTINRLLPGKNCITEQDWNLISRTYEPFAKWKSEKEGAAVEQLGLGRIREILSGAYSAQLTSLIEQDKALEKEVNEVLEVDKLVRYHRDLFTILKNFVTFHDFYADGVKAIFQAGTLYIDQRSCDLCIRVSDMGKHNTMASFSGFYLVYCNCTSRAGNEKMTIVAALTNGDIDNLSVGRNALFYDRNGLDWDATVVKIIDNPISIRQAFFSPYRKVITLVETTINKAAAAQEAKGSGDLSKSVEAVPVKVTDEKAKKEATPFDIGKFVGIFAAIGLAIGAIGTVLASAVGGFMKLQWWKMPLALLGIILLISGPSMILAYLKLRRRNLAPILDANGWAINARVIVNIRFGNTLTHLAELPDGAKVNVNDPFSKKKRPVLPVILFLLLVAATALYLLRMYGYVQLW